MFRNFVICHIYFFIFYVVIKDELIEYIILFMQHSNMNHLNI